MAKILVTDGMAAEGIALLKQAGHTVDSVKITADELLKKIGEYDGLVVRSATQVTAAVMKAGSPKLKIVGRAGVGVDNVDLKAATEHGIVAMNAPDGNTISAAEHTIGLIFASARFIPQAHAKLAKGEWDKKSYTGVELEGKVLGIIGLGKIGKHVAEVMQAAGMDVIAYDPFLSDEKAKEMRVRKVTVDELVAQADVISPHVPLTEQTRNLLNAERFAKMKKGVRIVNVARGGIIDEKALAEALKSGQVAVAALDVFEKEPIPADHPLIGVPNAILTPHLGASTEEAQTKVSVAIAHQFNAFFASGRIINAVNVQLRVDPAIDGWLAAAETLGAALVQTLGGAITGLEASALGTLAKHDTKPLAVAALKGALGRVSSTAVTFVNVNQVAKDRGIALTSSSSEQSEGIDQLVLTARTANGTAVIAGSLVHGGLRVTRFNDYTIDLPIGGHLLIMEYPDRPGMVGKYGSILGENRVNIARMEVSRIDGRGDALVILTLDDPVSPQVLEQIVATVKPNQAYRISL